MPRRSEIDRPAEAEEQSRIEVRDCFLCAQPIRAGEPFAMALALVERGRVANVPYHFFCHVDAIVDGVCESFDGDDVAEEEPEESLQESALRHLGELLAEATQRRRKR